MIYGCARDLYSSSKPVDEISGSGALAQRNLMEEAGGKHHVSELAAKVPAAGNAKHYAEIVRAHALERGKRQVGQELLNGLPPAEAIERLAALAAGETVNGPQAIPVSEIRPERVDWLWPGRVPLGMLTLLIGDRDSVSRC